MRDLSAPRRRGAFAATLAAVLLLAGCSGDPAEPDPAGTSDAAETTSETRQFEADNGTIEIPSDPQRIATLGSAGLFLDVGVEPVGMAPIAGNTSDNGLSWLDSEAQDANAAAVDLGNPAELDYEHLASLDPDLIVIHLPSHVRDSGSVDVDRLQTIAPTIWILIDNSNWQAQTARIADAVGQTEAFAADEEAYEDLITEIQADYGDLLASTTFTAVNRWGTGFTEADGAFNLEFPSSYCTGYLVEAGLTVVPDGEGLGEELPMEQLGDVAAGADVLIYPLAADGEPKTEFAPILDTNTWTSLPQVSDDKALGVQCNTILTYASKTLSLQSLHDALATLPASE